MLCEWGETAMSAVKGSRWSRVAVLVLAAGLAGCQTGPSAHYVVRNPDSGIVAIPQDTPDLRVKAEKLMHEQFPGGYVIDDVRTVLVGRPHHLHNEVMLYYHTGATPAPDAPVVATGTPPGTVVMPHVQQASLTAQPSSMPATSGGLPPQPVPVNAP
jgi:hypothetical protein